MITRRTFLQRASATCAISTLPSGKLSLRQHATRPPRRSLQWVDPRIGTGGHGHCFPGAAMPFGAVQLSPDTFNDDWDWCSGYHISEHSIMGFSHTHLSGTGCGDLLDFLVMAGTGPASSSPGDRRESPSRLPLALRPRRRAHGARLLLRDPEGLQDPRRTHRNRPRRPASLHLPGQRSAYLILDLQHCYGPGRWNVLSAELSQPAPDTLAGGHRTKAWGNGRHAYFTMQFSKKPEKIVFYSDDKEVAAPATATDLKGKNLKCVLYFKTTPNEAILVKTGISGVSAENAAKNLKQRFRHGTSTRSAPRPTPHGVAALQDPGQTANETHKKIFYTALYHMSLGPALFDDVDGQYRGMDNEVHTSPPASTTTPPSPVGHLPRCAPRLHAHRASRVPAVRQHAHPHGRAKPRRHARLAAARARRPAP
jgi:putative alpha-1,2-mannosidase